MWTKRGKACLILIFSTNTNCENMACRSFYHRNAIPQGLCAFKPMDGLRCVTPPGDPDPAHPPTGNRPGLWLLAASAFIAVRQRAMRMSLAKKLGEEAWRRSLAKKQTFRMTFLEAPFGSHWGQPGAKLLDGRQTQCRRGVRCECRKALFGASLLDRKSV